MSEPESKKCRMCKRPLTNLVSVKKGMGPVCRIKAEKNKQREFDFMFVQAEKKPEEDYVI